MASDVRWKGTFGNDIVDDVEQYEQQALTAVMMAYPSALT
jgi:hypothetical protein